nr:ribonuclease H-like domain-containing protein [Tanacetum cinerariifolium]
MAFLSSPSSTNEVDTASIQVSAAGTPVSTVSSPNNTTNLSDATVYAFLANQPNGSQLVHGDLVYFERTCKKITINGSDTAGYDKTKVECFNCHTMGHFTRECKSLRNQESRLRNQDNLRKTVIVEDTSSKAMVAIDGAGFDWSYLGGDEVPTNMALMASKTCFNTCLKNFETFKNQNDNLRIELNKYEFDLTNYKREKLKKEKESNQIKIDNFENASKSLDKLIRSQLTDNSKTGLGFTSYNTVARLPTRLFAPLTIDLSSSGLEEFKQPKFESYGPKASKSVCVDTSNVIKKVFDTPIIEDWVFDYDEDESEEVMVLEHVLKTVEKKTGQREVRPVWNHAMTINHQNLSNSRKNFTPTTVLTKSGIVPISTARQSSLRVAAPVSTTKPINTATPKPIVNVTKSRQNTFQKTHLLSRRPFHKQTSLKNIYLVNTTKVKYVNTVFTAKGKNVTSVVRKQGSNTGNKSFLSDYQEYDGGFLAFVGSSKGGKIIGKGKIRTGKLDFEDVYFVKELKFNLFSVLQMCDKKNSVLFTKTECIILSPDFKLPGENQILLKVPRKNNMYSFDLKNVVPSKGLTCLFAKATNDESNLWHRRLGHINFKTMNKLVKETFKAFRVYNSRTKKVEENMHVNFLENKPNVVGCGPEWLFDIDSLTNSMNYQPVSVGNRINGIAGSKIHFDVGQEGKEKVSDQEYILLPVLNTSSDVPLSNEEVESSPKDDDGKKSIVEPTCVEGGKIDDLGCLDQQMKSTNDSGNTNSTNSFNTDSPSVNTASDKDGTFQRTYSEWNFSTPILVNAAGSSFSHPAALDDFSKMLNLEDTGIFDDAYDDRDEGAEADYYHLVTMEPKKVTQALDDESWVEAMQEERSLSTEFEQLMHNRFQMSSMRELTFFLGLQVEQRKDGIFLSQDKYVCDILKKFGFSSVKSASTPMETHKPFSKDSDGTYVDVHLYRSMIGSLMHHLIRESYEKRLIEMVKIHTDSNIADLLTKAFDVTRFQFLVASIGIELKRYLLNDGYVDLVQHADKKELAVLGQTKTGNEFSNPLIAGSLPKTDNASSKTVNYVKQIYVIVDGKDVVILESLVRSDHVFDDEDEGHTSGSEEYRLEENIKLTDTVPKPHDLPLIGGYTPRSDEGRITLAELMETCTILSNRVTQLVTKLLTTKVVYNKHFITLTNRVKKLESQLKQKRSKAETGEHSRGDDDETLAETLMNIKRMSAKDKGKGIMKETELPKKLKKKEMIQLSLDEEPFSKVEVKKNMVMYLKNQGGYKQSYFKRMKYEDIRPLFERIWDQVHTFVPKDFKIEREVMKRVRFDLQQGGSKKQRLDQQAKETKEETEAQGESDQEVEELKLYMRIIPEEDIAIEAIPLAIKPLMIIEYKIVKKGKISTYHITRADGSTRRYTSMINLLE